MIISRTEIEWAVSAYRSGVRRKKNADPADPLGVVDTFESGSEGRSLAQLRSAVISQPLYRTDLVADLQRRVSEGKYYVPADQIVEKMIGRLLAEAASA